MLGLAVLILIARSTPAQDNPSVWMSSQLGQVKLQTDYHFTTSFNEPVARQRRKMHMMQHNFRFAFPLKQSDRYEWTLRTSVRALDLDTNARLPDTWDRFPSELWDVRLGTSYRHKFDNDWIAGGDLTIGSPSDRPFASGDEIAVSASGFLRIPHGERNAWLFLANYANNREFLPHVPIPGIAYHCNPSDQLSVLAGVPFTVVNWEPLDRLTLEASYLIPRRVHTQISYELIEALKLYAGFDWTSQRYYRHDRRDDDDRLSYYEKRVALGVHWDVRENIWLDLAGGWAFDRFWFEGEDYGDRGDNRLDLSDGPFVKFHIGFRI